MTYKIHEKTEGWELKDADGNIIASGQYPLTTPDDIIDAILDDMGVENPQRESFAVLFKRDWQFANSDEE